MIFPRRSFFSRFALAGALPGGQARSARSSSLAERLATAVDRIEAIDTHEHLIPEDQHVSGPMDFFTLASHYAISDLVSAGLPPDSAKLLTRGDAPLKQRWAAFEPYWKNARFTGYGQALRTAVRELYGQEEVTLATLPKINDAIATSNKPGLYKDLLKRRSRIRLAVLDDVTTREGFTQPDAELFVSARRFDRFVVPSSAADIRGLEKLADASITTLPELERALEKAFDRARQIGMVAVKSALAYQRELLFREVAEPDAAHDLEALLAGSRKMPAGFRQRLERPFRNLEDYMFHRVIRLAEAHRLPVQIHTGILAGNQAFLGNLDPLHLTNLFYLYPRVKFDLFHIGYPFQNGLGALAKLFPNVYADFCWAHIISPEAACRTLDEYLDSVPVNKILGFGGDYRYPALTYAHSRMARQNIARVLAGKVESGLVREEEALEIARLLLRDNPAAVFALG